MEKLEKQKCPICGEDTLEMVEDATEIPYFGKVFLFSMTCTSCKYHKADVEPAEQREPCKCTFDIENEKDLNVRIVKSGQATVKIPHMISIEPGPASNGFVTNVEGILKRVKRAIETSKEEAEDPSAKKKAKNMLKKLQKVMWGQEKLKLIIEDPSGNSAIVSEKTKTQKLK
ncbi:ZPR1 zinc finger domain-containing protein [Candidatus Woesearchaeota archaeon]|nr:ZPR1 zinc finger domain-containing protein [Candidatus Woesearchaeota archaeon]